ncbi:hypothetical protein N9153_00955 [Planctomicrobium sp.]|jgi:hypothetical protein|nr:hypothetical protein [Planctomicrobium sp.]
MSKEAYERHQSRRWFLVALVVLSPFILLAADDNKDSKPAPDFHKWMGILSRSDGNAEIIENLSQRTDEDLEMILDEILNLPGFRSRAGYEPCLGEIIKRGGQRWESCLKSKFDTLMESDFEVFPDVIGFEASDPGANFNLELLTALRRIKNQPDPLQIVISEPKELKGVGSAMPNLKVRITNLDAEKVSVGFTFGGDYRSGRQSRWRILVKDVKGKRVPVREHLGFVGGGISGEGILEYGKSWETSLDVRSFIELPPPGKYTLTVQYHNTLTIAGQANVKGLIVSRSNPVPFSVEPLTITYSPADERTVRNLVADLDGSRNLKIVAGTYGEWAHEFIPPDSPVGKLLNMGFPAVPTIIELLHDKTMTKEKRAWLLGILFSLTSENDPRDSSALGGHEYWESGWQIWGGQPGESPAGGMSFGSKGSVGAGESDSKAQKKLITTWDNWLAKVKVEERDADDQRGREPKSQSEATDSDESR